MKIFRTLVIIPIYAHANNSFEAEEKTTDFLKTTAMAVLKRGQPQEVKEGQEIEWP